MRKSSRKTPIKTRPSTAFSAIISAGEVSKDLTMRMLLPAEIVKAHEDGIIHFH